MSDLVNQLPFDSKRTKTERWATSFAEQPELPLNLPPLKRKPSRRWRSWEAVKVMNAAGLEPLEPYPGKCTKQWRCRCTKCKSTVSPRLTNVWRGGGCDKCRKRALSLSQDEAVKHMLAAGLEPLEPYPGNCTKQWRCRCTKCKSTVSPTLNNVQRGSGCNKCRQISDAQAVDDVLAAGFEPLEPYPGKTIKDWRCRCTRCGNNISVKLSIIRRGSGCKECAETGYKNHKPGTVYLLRSESLRAYKVGITNNPDQRLSNHEKHGWRVCGVLTFDDGAKARDIEQWVLGSWRSAGWAEAVAADLMPQGGWTETVAIVDCGDDLNLEALYAEWQEVAA